MTTSDRPLERITDRDRSYIRAQLADCTLHELLDIAGGVLHLLGVRARLTHDRWSALASVLRRHGIDPESPTASSDLDHLLRGTR